MNRSILFALSAWVAVTGGVSAADVTLQSSKDNTLYESAAGDVSNGAGQNFTAGRTNQLADFLRRGLIAFDVAGSVPAGATVTGVELKLTVTQTNTGDQPIELRRVTADWGEGASNGSSPGQGASAQTGDATWTNRFFPSTNWTTAGGDYSLLLSATASAGILGTTPTWSSAQLTADVQDMLDNPSGNFGWILIGNEAAAQTTKSFGTKEHTTAASRPQLTVTFTPPSGIEAWDLYN